MAEGMKKILLTAIAIFGLMTAAPLSAQHGGGSPKPPKPVKTTHGPSAPKTTTHVAAPHKTTPGGGHTIKTTKAPTGATPKAAKAPKTTKTTTEPKAAKASKAATTTTTSTTLLTPVQQKLQRNTNLASKLQSRLPAGTDLNLASAGFRNLGQFVAAVNVSNNLGIPFAQLKTRMVDRDMSLGQAIQDARPATGDTTVVVRRAETDAYALIRTTEQATVAKPNKVKKNAGGN